MSKYRKKPIIIDAETFFPDQNLWPEGVQASATYSDDQQAWPIEPSVDAVVEAREQGAQVTFWIDTLEGRALNVTPGDYIITGIKGERYPCKADVFEQIYEAVDELA